MATNPQRRQLADFERDLQWSRGLMRNPKARAALLSYFPTGSTIEELAGIADRHGIDGVVVTPSGVRSAIDWKRLLQDRSPHDERLLLEIWSNREAKIRGWTLADNKHCEYVFWFYESTGRHALMPFVLLQTAFRAHLDEWCEKYGTWEKWNRGPYCTVFTTVPRKVILKAIRELSDSNTDQLGFEGWVA